MRERRSGEHHRDRYRLHESVDRCAAESETITRGQSAKLVVWASGAAPLAYQWYTVAGAAETAIPGATTAAALFAPSETTTYRIKVANDCDTVTSDATVTVVDPPTVPAGVTATYSASSAATLVTWTVSTSSAGIEKYLVVRYPDKQTFWVTAPSTSLTDSTTLVDRTTYSYRVRSLDNHGAYSEVSAPDMATVMAFSDDPPISGVTVIRGVHIGELRQAIDAVRKAGGLAPAWSSYAPESGSILAAYFTEMRARLNEARFMFFLPDVVFSDRVAAGELIFGRTIIELRNGVR